MSKTISINAGSSSLKWQLYLMPEEKVLAKGLLERIGLKDSIMMKLPVWAIVLWLVVNTLRIQPSLMKK